MKQNSIHGPDGRETRRDFLKKAATTVAAVAATGVLKTPVYGQAAAPSANVVGANNKLVLGFIGLGNQGLNSHLRTMVANAAASNIAAAAVCDVSKTRREEGLKAAGQDAKAYEDYRQLLERKDIDAIVCSTVDHWHARVTLDALGAGKHVYVEKPLTRYLGEAFAVHDAVKKTGRVLQVGAQRCSVRKWHTAAEWIKAGKIGQVVMCQGSYMRNTAKGEWNYPFQAWATAEDVNWPLWLGDQIKTRKEFSAEDYFRWRKYYRYCAGLLGDLVPHTLHPHMLATGAPEFPRRVSAVGTQPVHRDKATPGTPERDSPEIVQLIAEFPSGLVLHFTSSTVNEQGLPEMIRGDKATLSLGGNNVVLRPERPFADDIEPESSPDYPPEDFAAHHKDFFDSIRETRPPTGNIELAVRVQTVLSLAEMSDRLSVMCLFDEKTRTIATSDGKELQPLTYGSVEGRS